MVNPVRNISKPLNPTGFESKRNPASGQRSIISNRVKLKYVLIALILIAIGIGVSLTLFQSEEKRVRKQFHLLSGGVSKEPGENIFTMDQKIKKIGSFFDETCEINIPAHSVSGRLTRDEITGYAARGRLHFSELLLKFYDFDIAFPQQVEAKVRLTARLTGKTTTGEAVNEAHEIDCLLRKIEKKWMFSHIEFVEVLKK
jgi:hypothetical protein